MILTIGVCFGQIKLIKNILSKNSIVWLWLILIIILNKSTIMLSLIRILKGISFWHYSYLLLIRKRFYFKFFCKFYDFLRLTHSLLLWLKNIFILCSLIIKILLFLFVIHKQILGQVRIRFLKLFTLFWWHKL